MQTVATLWAEGQPGPPFTQQVSGRCFFLSHCLITWRNNPGGVGITSRGYKVRGRRLSLTNSGSERRRRCQPGTHRSRAPKGRAQTAEGLPDGISPADGKPPALSSEEPRRPRSAPEDSDPRHGGHAGAESGVSRGQALCGGEMPSPASHSITQTASVSPTPPSPSLTLRAPCLQRKSWVLSLSRQQCPPGS